MVAAEELRVGNYVKIDGKIVIVSDISKDYLEGWDHHIGFSPKIDDFEHCLLDHVEPIELNPGEFEKLGFKLEGTNFFKDDFGVYWVKEEKFEYYQQPHTELKHVHQLQNLYYAIKQEEIVYK